jgi:hypothetical protein
MQRNETEIQNSVTDQKLWNMKDPNEKRNLARQIATKCAKAEPTDIFVYDRIFSRLLNGSGCPEMFGFTVQTGNMLVGDGRKVSFS